MTGLIYMGPYNDPLDPTGKHHWDTPHAPDCRNPSLCVSISVGSGGHKTFHIDLTVRNADPVDHAGYIIKLFGSYKGSPFSNSTQVDTFISTRMISPPPPVAPTLIAGPWTGQTIPRRGGLGDNPWRPPSGNFDWTPSPPNEATTFYVFVIAATVAEVDPFSPPTPTRNAQVAVWVGP